MKILGSNFCLNALFIPVEKHEPKINDNFNNYGFKPLNIWKLINGRTIK